MSYAVVSTGTVDVIGKVYSNHIEIVEHAPNVDEITSIHGNYVVEDRYLGEELVS